MPGGDPLDLQLIAIAKAPIAGRAKTRLSPPFALEGAAALAAAALDDTLQAMTATPVRARCVAFDGDPEPWVPEEIAVFSQRGNGLDERLAAAFDDAWAAAPLPTLLIGMDTPQVEPALLREAGRQLLSDGVDAVFGHATDGGWWALGLRKPDPSLLLGVPMSTEHTGVAQLARLQEAGLAVAELPVLADVDTADDAAAVAAAAPGTRFAATLAALSAAGNEPQNLEPQ